jgi:hypothetical protein
MDLTTDSSGGLDDPKRGGYKITGICLETNLRVNKKRVIRPVTKKLSKLLSIASDQAHRSDVGNNVSDNVKIIIPVKNHKKYTTQDLDDRAEEARQIFWKKFNLRPSNVKRQFYVRLTLLSSDGVHKHTSRMLSYINDDAKESLLVYIRIHKVLVYYDGKGRVINSLMANDAIPLMNQIDKI